MLFVYLIGFVFSFSFHSDDDDDAPYSPGGGSEADEEQETAAAATVAPAAPAIMPAELQLEVERLNRQIEAQKNEIVEMLAKDPLVSDLILVFYQFIH